MLGAGSDEVTRNHHFAVFVRSLPAAIESHLNEHPESLGERRTEKKEGGAWWISEDGADTLALSCRHRESQVGRRRREPHILFTLPPRARFCRLEESNAAL